jgi:alkanesulfonate monooxygenase SsuD/methylene tetrahydromethanopterin reductase-like flavin-dependent oxidoreductase (luciferase family)
MQRSHREKAYVLTFVAARTDRIAVGSSVLNLVRPGTTALLARRLTTLDILSGGQLRLGFGIGWSQDEYDAAGVPWKERGRRADESLSALKAIWTMDPVEIEGAGFRIPKSHFGLKPFQRPHPPIYMAAYSPGAMKRAAREANGWFPVGVPFEAIPPMFETIKGMVKEAGRNPEPFELLVRGNIKFTESAVSNDRGAFTGNLDQIAEDIASTPKLAAAELVLDVQFSPEVKTKQDILDRMEALKRIAG